MNTTTLNPTELQEQDVFKEVRKLRGFYLHLMKYVIVNLGLLAINLILSPRTLWFYWVMLGWGLGLLLHGAGVWLSLGGGGLQERLLTQERARLAHLRDPW